MDYVRLGKSGLKVSRICLGMMTYGSPKWRPWVLDEEASRPFIKRAVEAGINFFDTANLYSNGLSEILTGKLLREYTKRDEVIIATKVYFHVSDSIGADAASLKSGGIPPSPTAPPESFWMCPKPRPWAGPTRPSSLTASGLPTRTSARIPSAPSGKRQRRRQVVRKICVIVSALRRSVSFYCSLVNWNLQR